MKGFYDMSDNLASHYSSAPSISFLYDSTSRPEDLNDVPHHGLSNMIIILIAFLFGFLGIFLILVVVFSTKRRIRREKEHKQLQAQVQRYEDHQNHDSEEGRASDQRHFKIHQISPHVKPLRPACRRLGRSQPNIKSSSDRVKPSHTCWKWPIAVTHWWFSQLRSTFNDAPAVPLKASKLPLWPEPPDFPRRSSSLCIHRDIAATDMDTACEVLQGPRSFVFRAPSSRSWHGVYSPRAPRALTRTYSLISVGQHRDIGRDAREFRFRHRFLLKEVFPPSLVHGLKHDYGEYIRSYFLKDHLSKGPSCRCLVQYDKRNSRRVRFMSPVHIQTPEPYARPSAPLATRRSAPQVSVANLSSGQFSPNTSVSVQ